MNMAKKIVSVRFDADHLITATIADIGRQVYGARDAQAAMTLVLILQSSGATNVNYKRWENGCYRTVVGAP